VNDQGARSVYAAVRTRRLYVHSIPHVAKKDGVVAQLI
jgi:hypothetical protein